MAASVDSYIAALPDTAQSALRELRALVHAAVPDVTERIAYGMPTFDVGGRLLLHVAAWKKHIAVYPVSGALADAIRDDPAARVTGKGTLQLSLGKPIPRDLVRRVIRYRLSEQD